MLPTLGFRKCSALLFGSARLRRNALRTLSRPDDTRCAGSSLGRTLHVSALTALVLVVFQIALSSSSRSADETTPAAQTTAATAPTQAFAAGDIATSGFAGTTLQTEALPPGVDPVTKTVIDVEGITVRIFDGRSIGAAPTGQSVELPVVFTAKARDIGHVFALAFDQPSVDQNTAAPALYAAATSAFGIQILGPDKDADGKPDRLKKGAPGATFMPGQFGGLANAGPGTIYKIDQATGAISVFSNVLSEGKANAGPGLGGLAVDSFSRTLYVSDLDTGLIHALGLTDGGAEHAVFDHGVNGRPLSKKKAVADDGERMDITTPDFDTTKPSTWGFTATERRIDALAVHGNRLYYAVAEGPQIWSIALAKDGKFEGQV